MSLTMYQQLRKALTGSEKDDNLPKNYSPNCVKAIVITRSFILVSYHDRPPKLVQLNINETTEEISKNGSKGSLQNVLMRRQLSCLEEIYVDVVFKNYLGMFNLKVYIDSLISNACRLRYYGYIDTMDYNELLSFYFNSKANSIKNAVYAEYKEHKLPIEVYNTGNDEWFRKYNLRPNEYSLDSEKGVLFSWFKSVENAIENEYNAKKAESESDLRKIAYTKMLERDLGLANYFIKLKNLKGVLKSGEDALTNSIIEAISNAEKGLDVENRIYKKDLVNVLNSLGLSQKDKTVGYLLGVLHSSGCLQEESFEINLKRLTEVSLNGGGFINFDMAIKRVIRKVIERQPSKMNILMMCVEARKLGSPRISSFESLKSWLTELQEVKQYRTIVDFIIRISGFTDETLDIVLSERSEG